LFCRLFAVKSNVSVSTGAQRSEARTSVPPSSGLTEVRCPDGRALNGYGGRSQNRGGSRLPARAARA
jgi:hypothetical protein